MKTRTKKKGGKLNRKVKKHSKKAMSKSKQKLIEVIKRKEFKGNNIQQNVYSDDEISAQEMLEMVDVDLLSYMNGPSDSFDIYKQVKTGSVLNIKERNPKINYQDNSKLEDTYEQQTKMRIPMKSLLPIKTQHGLVPQQIIDESEGMQVDPNDNNAPTKSKSCTSNDNEDLAALHGHATNENQLGTNYCLQFNKSEEKFEEITMNIGFLSSTILENPENKIYNLKLLLDIMEANENVTLKKLVIASLLDVFKDLLPSYEIKNVFSESIKLKKDTLNLKKYEENLLLYYKKFLMKLETFCRMMKLRNSRENTDTETVLGELAVKCLCELLVEHPNFNYASNIIDVIVPFMNYKLASTREMVKKAFVMLFKTDKKYEITLKSIRAINHYMKKHANRVHSEMVQVLLALNINELVSLDHEKNALKERQRLTRKKIFQMSRSDRKRGKKMQQLEKQLLETKAEENKQFKEKNLTEITKMIFEIYFKVIKTNTAPDVLKACLEGLTKFAHCLNIEFYMDIVNQLHRLLSAYFIGCREKLCCIQTAFAMCSGQAESLNIDPIRFYTSFYKDLLFYADTTSAEEQIELLLNVLSVSLIERRKKNSRPRMLNFTKRLTTLSLQLLHNSALGTLCVVKQLLQQNNYLDVLLDVDDSIGSGPFRSDIDNPEYANAESSALYELPLLTKHYHPMVRKFTTHILSHSLMTINNTTITGYSASTPESLFREFSMEEMSFTPPIPPPIKIKNFQLTVKKRSAFNFI